MVYCGILEGDLSTLNFCELRSITDADPETWPFKGDSSIKRSACL